jgi:hypothetical protein
VKRFNAAERLTYLMFRKSLQESTGEYNESCRINVSQEYAGRPFGVATSMYPSESTRRGTIGPLV